MKEKETATYEAVYTPNGMVIAKGSREHCKRIAEQAQLSPFFLRMTPDK